MTVIMKNCISYIALAVALLSLLLSLLHLFDYIPQKNNPCNNYNDVIGILVSSVALVVSLYFIILGIRGNQIQDDIRNANEKFEETVEKALIKPATEVSKLYYDLYSKSIALLNTIYNNLPDHEKEKNDYLDKLKLAQARIACNVDFFDDKDKTLMGINMLKNKSIDRTDLDLMATVMDNPKSDKDIKNAARQAYRAIEDRLRA